jgi:hypothetical protein
MMTNGHVLPEDLDLNEIFIGRERQLNDFRVYLGNWRQLTSTPSLPPLTLPPSPTQRIPGFFVLLHGRGGFGKSTLLAHYHQIASEKRHDLQVSEVVDWETAAHHQRAIFHIKDRENIDFYRYFRLIATRLAAALHKQLKDFSAYRRAEHETDKARGQAYDLLDQLQQHESFSWLRGIGVARDALLALVSLVSPGVNAILSNDLVLEKTRALFDAGTGIGIEHMQRLAHHIQEGLGKDLSDYLDAPLRLGLALGRDLAHFAERSPLLIFFDTYEVIDEGDWLLQICMGAAGERVGWVISGRDNLWAGTTQMHRSLEAEYGYRDLVFPERSYVVDFSADGVGSLTPSDIHEYFLQICERTGLVMPSGDPLKNSARVLEITRGIPLAVRIVASLYLEKQDLALITQGVDQRRAIVEQMVQRYLLHTRDTPSDRMRLYALALLRQIDDPSVIAVALGVSP